MNSYNSSKPESTEPSLSLHVAAFLSAALSILSCFCLQLDHDLKHAHELRQAAFKLYASLGSNDEDIRKKVSSASPCYHEHFILLHGSSSCFISARLRSQRRRTWWTGSSAACQSLALKYDCRRLGEMLIHPLTHPHERRADRCFDYHNSSTVNATNEIPSDSEDNIRTFYRSDVFMQSTLKGNQTLN